MLAVIIVSTSIFLLSSLPMYHDPMDEKYRYEEMKSERITKCGSYF